jgi:hypothetical protein
MTNDYQCPTQSELYESIAIDNKGDRYQAYYMRRLIAQGEDRDALFLSIRRWCEKEHYWPDIYYVNDHGNVTLYDDKGNDVASWV